MDELPVPLLFFFFFWITAYISNKSYDGNQLSLSGFPLGPAYYDRCLYLHPKNWKKTTHVHATSRTQRAQSKNFLTQPTSNYPREERVSYLDTLTGGMPRACPQYLLFSVYDFHPGPCSSSASARRRSRYLEKPSSRSLERGHTPK